MKLTEINPINPTLVLRVLPTGDFHLKTLLKDRIVKSDDLWGTLFLMNISSEVRQALQIEINEMTSTYWEFDKQIILRSEWVGPIH